MNRRGLFKLFGALAATVAAPPPELAAPKALAAEVVDYSANEPERCYHHAPEDGPCDYCIEPWNEDHG